MDFDPDLAGIPDPELKMDRFRITREQGTLFLDLSPAVGIGRQKNVTPLYQVFKLEKELLRKGAINFPLSDKTMLAIAQLLARHNTYTLKKMDATKEFKRILDSIIVLDGAIERERLRYVSPLELKKIILCQVPPLMAKPQAALFTTSRMVPRAAHSETVYPYGVTTDAADTSYIAGSFTYEHLLGLRAACGIPLTSWWFLDLKAYRNLLATDTKIDFLTAHDHVRWNNVLDMRWDMQTSFWPINWMLLNIGIDNLPSWLCVPRATPLSTYLASHFFIEDYCSLITRLAYKRSGKRYTAYEQWAPSFTTTGSGFLFTCSVTYNF